MTTKILLIIIGGILLSCQGNKKSMNTPSIDDTIRYEVQHNPNEEISMKTLHRSYCFPLSEIEVHIVNNSNKDIITGVDYVIEYFTENKWIEIPLHYAFIDIAIVIPPNKSEIFTIDLQQRKYTYQKGLYRVIKTIRTNSNHKILKAQFQIQ